MWKHLRKLLHFIAYWQITLLMAILYTLVVVPLGFVQKFFIKPNLRASNWVDFAEKYQNPEDLFLN